MSDRPPLPHDPARVRQALQRRVPEILARLGIAEQARGGIVTPLNPTRQDRTPGSFVIWTQGDGAGAWNDYATGEKGDVFDLIRYLGRLARWIDAYWWALDFLGLGRGEVRAASQDQQARERFERERKAAEARAAAEADEKARKARGVWLGCAADIRGTPVWTYLTKARGLPMDKLDPLPGALRFALALEHYDRETGEITEWPAMVTAMSAAEGGQVRAAHRTWLTSDGMGKAPVPNAKKMLGVAKGCAVRLWKGASGLTPEKAAERGVTGPLVITEGIEDGLTAAIARPDYRVWAAGSLGAMEDLTWPACASAVVLVADNDWDKPQAVAAFERVEAHWRAQAKGRAVSVVRSQVGKDLNDWARGQG